MTMTNTTNVRSMITVMRRVRDAEGALDMNVYQDVHYDTDFKDTESAAMDCDTACCLMGWYAISPEGIAAGWTKSKYKRKSPTYKGEEGDYALANFLGIPVDLAAKLSAIHGDSDEFYGVETSEDITFDQVIDALEELI